MNVFHSLEFGLMALPLTFSCGNIDHLGVAWQRGATANNYIISYHHCPVRGDGRALSTGH